MKFNYNHEKNIKLIQERGIGFEEIIELIANKNLIKIVNHHNQVEYPNQKIMYVRYIDKVYLIPYIKESYGTLFLKTIYQSRKATKKLYDGKLDD
jgi:uncharacterized DUF497 family protein